MIEEKMLTWWQPNFTEEDAKAVFEVVQSGYINEGEITDKLCNFVKEYLGIKHVITTNSGSSANLLALSSLTSEQFGERSLKPNDEVITVPNSFVATSWAISYCGAIPVFVDVDPDTFLLNHQLIKDAISNKTKAIIPVHFAGFPVDLAAIENIAKKYEYSGLKLHLEMAEI